MGMISPVLTLPALVSNSLQFGHKPTKLTITIIASCTDRLPTVAASQALEDLKNDPCTHISTGLESLDRALLGSGILNLHSQDHRGGVKRGQVTELWGPPGTGRTAVG
jgi:RecA/RadA recombinase